MSILYVVGLGPGDYESMSIKADKTLRQCETIVGYHVYIDLIKERYTDKKIITTPMTREAERCRLALEEARAGRVTAMVCSGDSGIYGMAALLYELRGAENEPEIVVIPGLTAACSGGAILGAPLTHDFAVISLSDRLTPWEKISTRLIAAAQADFSIVIYNPASNGRPHHLRMACDILLKILPADRPCGIARNIGRKGEDSTILPLAELRDAEVDMFCTVFVGNSMTEVIGDRLITPRGYRYE